MKLHEQDVFDKRFGRRVGIMIELRLIGYKHYYPWADEVIMAMEEPPSWILEIATIKYFPKALEVIYEFVSSPPFEPFDAESNVDEYLACLFLRYKRGEISWATFLNEAGLFTDARNGHRPCEDFYCRLNDLEDSEFAKDIEQNQRDEVELELVEALNSVQALYDGFLEHFRLYVSGEPEQKQPSKFASE